MSRNSKGSTFFGNVVTGVSVVVAPMTAIRSPARSSHAYRDGPSGARSRCLDEDVRGQERIVRLVDAGQQGFDSPVELVIADRGRVDTERVQDVDARAPPVRFEITVPCI